MNANRTAVTVTLPKAQLERPYWTSALVRVRRATGAVQPLGNFFSGNPNSQQQVYQIAQQKIQTAARQSPLLTEAQKNTEGMLTGMLTSLGFQHVIVTFGSQVAGARYCPRRPDAFPGEGNSGSH